MIGIVCSRADEASEHITEWLLEFATWREHTDDEVPDGDGGGTYYRTGGAELRFFDDLHLDIEDAADPFGDIDWLAFASRHSGETGPLLTAHVTGNFGQAQYGGTDGGLATAAPAALSAVVAGFDTHAPQGYDIGIECTHHGPSEVGVPSMFVELGSGPDQWTDEAGARAVARTILDARNVQPWAPTENGTRRHVVGIGGGHYAPRFTRIVRETDWHVGHVAADWCLEELGDPEAGADVLDRAFDRSGADVALVDGDHPEVVDVVESLGYRIVSETWLRETTGVALGLVERIEAALCTVEDGLRFGVPAAEHEGDVVVASLPTAVIDEARALDEDATRAAVERHALAFETEQSGTRLGERAAFATDEDRGTLVDDLVGVLETNYEVERTDDTVRIREAAFDPSLAAELGVPEGPKFGALSNGQPVTVDGERIDPEDVTTERVRELPIS